MLRDLSESAVFQLTGTPGLESGSCRMTDRITPNQSQPPDAGDSQLAKPGPRPIPIGTRLLLLGGGFMAAWGTLVTVALSVVLVIQGPGPGGPTPFLLGGFVIGLAPIGFGAILVQLGRERLRQTRANVIPETSGPATTNS